MERYLGAALGTGLSATPDAKYEPDRAGQFVLYQNERDHMGRLYSEQGPDTKKLSRVNQMLRLRGARLRKRMDKRSKNIPQPGKREPVSLQKSIANDLALAIETQDLIEGINKLSEDD